MMHKLPSSARLMTALLALCVSSLTACGGGECKPPTVDVTGSWEGTHSDPYGARWLKVTLIQNSEGDVSGTYSEGTGTSGTVSGQICGNSFSFNIAATSPAGCSSGGTAAGAVAGSQIVYSGSGRDCEGNVGNASGTLTKQ